MARLITERLRIVIDECGNSDGAWGRMCMGAYVSLLSLLPIWAFMSETHDEAVFNNRSFHKYSSILLNNKKLRSLTMTCCKLLHLLINFCHCVRLHWISKSQCQHHSSRVWYVKGKVYKWCINITMVRQLVFSTGLASEYVVIKNTFNYL